MNRVHRRIGVRIGGAFAAFAFLFAGMACANPALPEGIEGSASSEAFADGARAVTAPVSKFVAFMHVNVNCSDFDTSYAFYKLFGFEIISVPFYGSMKVEQKVDAEFAEGLRLPPYEIVAAPLKSKFDGTLIDLIRFKEPYDASLPYAGINHLGIVMLTFETTDLDADMRYLTGQGISFVGGVRAFSKNSVAYRYALVKDPDGNVIQLLENKKAKAGKSYYGKKLKIARFLYATVNVMNLDSSKEFYKMVGFKLSEEATVSGEFEAGSALGVTGAYSARIALMKMSKGTGVLLQQWEGVHADSEAPYAMLNHIGYARIAIETTNIQSDYQRLTGLGVEFYAEPKKPTGKLAFITFACFQDLDGTVLEAAHSSAPKFPGF
jgi:catechol 2,3-dioxygenase-like lactoylglutathione lyase family enzyme